MANHIEAFTEIKMCGCAAHRALSHGLCDASRTYPMTTFEVLDGRHDSYVILQANGATPILCQPFDGSPCEVPESPFVHLRACMESHASRGGFYAYVCISDNCVSEEHNDNLVDTLLSHMNVAELTDIHH